MKLDKCFGHIIWIPDFWQKIEVWFYRNFIHRSKPIKTPWWAKYEDPVFLKHPEWFDSEGNLIPNA